jgi:hypothetical protein
MIPTQVLRVLGLPKKRQNHGKHRKDSRNRQRTASPGVNKRGCGEVRWELLGVRCGL